MHRHCLDRVLIAVCLICAMLLAAAVPAQADLNPQLFDGNGQGATYEAPPQEEEEDERSRPEQRDSGAASRYQDQIDDINDLLQELAEEKQQLEARVESLGDAREREVANLQQIDARIGMTREEITLLQERVLLLEQDIQHKMAEIEDKQAEIDQSYGTLKIRLRAMQLNDDATVLGLLLGADSFSDFLSHSIAVSRIAQHDQALMERLAGQKRSLQEDRAELERNRRRVEEDRAATEQRQQELDVQLQKANLAIHDLQEMERQYLADLEKNLEEQEQVQRELEAIYRRIEWDKNPYVGGDMLWPLPGGYNITSGYGMRFGGTNNHTGVDMTYAGGGTFGADIVAANDGTVQFVNWAYTQGVGYGIYLIVDHGGGLTTLYAHCSNIVVSEGQRVRRGEKIAEVGNTGWSTGPHLHFEVRLNGTHQPPLNYLTA